MGGERCDGFFDPDRGNAATNARSAREVITKKLAAISRRSLLSPVFLFPDSIWENRSAVAEEAIFCQSSRHLWKITF
jgi:hypothetical protein